MGARMQPIRSLDTIRDMEVTLARLEDTHGRRMFLLFEVGIRLGLRVGDMVQLKVGDLRGQKLYTYLPQKQAHKKSAQKITISIDAQLRKILKARCGDMADGDWLFPSRTRTPNKETKHISRQTALADIKQIQQLTHCPIPLGCHSLRKTFGYQYYQKNHDIAILQEWFYHESPATTLIYIGVTADNFTKMTDNSPFAKADDLPL